MLLSRGSLAARLDVLPRGPQICSLQPSRPKLQGQRNRMVDPRKTSMPSRMVQAQGMQAVSEAEAAANEKRREEAGNQGNSDEWSWTLNWDRITEDITVGSCPRSPSDLDRLVDEAGIDAVICLQSELCHEALQIDWEPIRTRAVERAVVITRVSVRDFDHGDQALMLPEAVRMLYLLLSMGKKVYVHCTAGINRATLTVVGYLTFVQSMDLDDAVAKVKTARPQAHPYIDCWKTVRSRLLEGRTEELMGLAKAIYRQRSAEGRDGDSDSDWKDAQKLLIREGFQRQLGCAVSLISVLKDIEEVQLDSLTCLTTSEVEVQSREVARLREDISVERARFSQVAKELDAARQEVAMLRLATVAANGGVGAEVLAELDVLQAAKRDIEALRDSIQQIARTTAGAGHPVGTSIGSNGASH
mmetsp:Transcript_5611/g.16038  ORF Transcript_5611/g.16038 Transcript_5611/m.16038 type:complete len:416 (-) Transcript_5611:646-1893(-)